jgi:plasmid stabilization system protein ParE
MGAPTVVKSAAALRDFRRSYAWIAVDGGPVRAEKNLARLDRVMERLAKRPLLGPPRPEASDDVRGFSVYPWIIIYRPLPDRAGVNVLRILDSRQDLAALLGKKT